MRRATLTFVALMLVLVPAPAGAGTTRPPLGLAVTPARVALAGTGKASVRITNPGVGAVVVDVARAGFSLDLRGRPHVVARAVPRAATPWLTVRPGRFVLPAGVTASPSGGRVVPAPAGAGTSTSVSATKARAVTHLIDRSR